ncbi:MAG: phosphoglycerate dehydrogenase [Oligoflexus sp.]
MLKPWTVGVTAKSFLANKALCEALIDQCPGWTVRFADADLVDDRQYLQDFLSDVSHWVVGREAVDATNIAKAKQLRIVSKYGVGLDNIDFDACARAGISVRWRPGVNAQAVAELTIGLMISLSRNIHLGASRLQQGHWWKNGGIAFSGKTVGIIGVGAIGSRVARLARGFSCQVLLCDILLKDRLAEEIGASQLDLDELVSQSDFVSLHVPLTVETRTMMDRQRLARMQQHAFLVNTSRGEVIDQEALKLALRKRYIAGAALDVFADEPLKDKDLYSLENFIGTAHIAGNSREAVWAMGQAAIDGVKEKGYCQLSNEPYIKGY